MTFEKTFRRGDAVTVEGRRATFVRLSLEPGSAIVEYALESDRIIYGHPARVPFADLRHAPVAVAGAKPAAAPTACPDCGSVLQVDPEAETVVDGRRRTVRAAFCTGCEYAVRLTY